MLSATALPLVVSADSVDNKIEAQTKKINDLQSKEASATSQLATIQGSIASIREEANALQTKQVELGKEITSLNNEVKDLETRIAKRDASIKEQARSVQVDGSSSNVVELVMNSDSVSDAVTKVMAATKLVGANNDMMKQQKEDKDAVEEKKVVTEEKAVEVQETAVALESKKGELEDQELAQTAVVSGIAAEKETETSKKAELETQKVEAEKQRAAQKAAAEAAQKLAQEQAAQEKVAEEQVVQETQTQVVPTTNTTEKEEQPAQSQPVQEQPIQNQTQNQTQNKPAQTTPPKQVEVSNPGPAANGNAVVSEAYKHLGKPYVWGAKGPGSFDCSGFTSYVYRQAAGKEIGGWTVPQESAGTQISLSQLQPGDLVFWGSRGATYHVGIYVGGGQYIHAPQPGENVKVTSISDWSPAFGVRVN